MNEQTDRLWYLAELMAQELEDTYQQALNDGVELRGTRNLLDEWEGFYQDNNPNMQVTLTPAGQAALAQELTHG